MVQRALDQLVGEGRMRDAGVGVARPNEVRRHLASHAAGEAALTASTQVCIGSITKLLTAVAVLRLCERGLLDLGSPVARWVPGLKFNNPDWADRITLRHLLSHTSGLPAGGRDFGPTEPKALAHFVAEDLAHHRFVRPPGQVWLYSSTAICLTAYVMERATDRPFEEVLSAEVLEPAAMANASYPPALGPTAVWPYELDEPGAWHPAAQRADNRSGYASGFLYASLDDLMAFGSNLLGGRLIKRRSLAVLAEGVISRHIDWAPTRFAGVASEAAIGGLIGTWNGQRLLRHGGMQQSFNCSLDLLLDSDTIVATLTNGADDSAFTTLWRSALESVAGELPEPRQLDGDPVTEARAAAATYVDVDTGSRIAISPDGSTVSDSGDGGLVRVRPGQYLEVSDDGAVPVGIPEVRHPEYIIRWGQPYLRIDPHGWDDADDRYTGVYRDAFHPDADAITVRIGPSGWSVEDEEGMSDAQPINPRTLLSSRGLIEFEPGGRRFQLGYATWYSRTD